MINFNGVDNHFFQAIHVIFTYFSKLQCVNKYLGALLTTFILYMLLTCCEVMVGIPQGIELKMKSAGRCLCTHSGSRPEVERRLGGKTKKYIKDKGLHAIS